MQHLKRKLLFEIYRLIDSFVMVVSLSIAIIFFSLDSQFNFDAPLEFFALHINVVNFILLGLFMVIWPVNFTLFGLYQSQRYARDRDEFINIIKAVSLSTVFLAVFSTIFDRQDIVVSTLVAFCGICSLLTFLTRLTIKKILFQVRKHGRNLRHVLIIGNQQRGVKLAEELMNRKELGFSILGFVDEEKNMTEENSKYKYLCTIDELPYYLGKNVVDAIFITLPMKSYYNKISDILAVCQEFGIPVHLPVNFFNGHKMKIKSVDDGLLDTSFILHYNGKMEQSMFIYLKRTIDVLASFVLIVLLAPVFIIVAILIKVSSGGSVFFIQERIGYNKRKFKLLKFRTMVENAESLQKEIEHMNQADGAVFKIENDPRVTSLGRLLRKTSLDELPQLINVFFGDMSLVGPRPLPMRDVNLFDKEWQKRRFSVRPGITGLWQINGRSQTKFDRLIKFDLEYIDNWSPWLDIIILCKTVPVVLSKKGAM